MDLAQLDYELPPDRIATHAAEPRDSARLMVIHRASKKIEHRLVRDLPALLGSSDLMIFNQSRVVPANFQGVRLATKGWVGGLFLTAPALKQWHVLLESRGTLRVGERVGIGALSDAGHEFAGELELLEKRDRGQWLVRLHSELDTMPLLEKIGSMPLPPYIRQQRRLHGEAEIQPGDHDRYNTVYARDPGSVAAPTAGLHFTPELLASLDRLGVQRKSLTLHVGMGTFAPVRTQRIEDHEIHREWLQIPRDTIDAVKNARATGRRIVVVGTTSVRAIESLPDVSQRWPENDFVTDTQLFITPGSDTSPGFQFRFTDVLMTNFHLPQSTLLAMVAALPNVGIEQLKTWYALAVQEKYRFYSYGDAMLLLP